MSRTLAQARTTTQARLRNTGVTLWANAEVDTYVKEGYSDFVALTGALWKKDKPAGLDDVAHQALYDVPSDCIEIERMTYIDRRIFPLSSRRLMEINGTYETEEGDVYGYVWDKDGVGKLRKVSIPPVTLAATTGIEYRRREVALSLDASTFEIPDHMVKYVIYYACARALERFGPGQNIPLAQHYKARYAMGLMRTMERRARARRARAGMFGESFEGKYGPPPRPRMPPAFGPIVE